MDMNNVAAIENPTEGTNVIGFLCWYSVGEDLYQRETLRKKLLDATLEEKYLPNRIRPADAFRRATKSIETLNVDGDEIGEVDNYLIRDVALTKELIQRNIVKERRDTNGQRLEYLPDAAELVFDRKEEKFHVKKTADITAEELADEAKVLFDKFLTHHNASAVRSSVQSVLKTMSPTPVRPSGGVYFVPNQYKETLVKMISFLQSLEKGEGFMIPLIDSEENRDMVKQKVNEHLFEMIQECKTVLTKQDIPKGVLKQTLENARRVVGDFQDYREIIQGSIGHMEDQVDLIRQQVQLLFDRVSSESKN